MVQTIEALFDGVVFRPTEPLSLAPNTRVRITVESVSAGQTEGETRSFLETARSLKLEGPSDWSLNLDKYLYGEEPPHEG